MGALSGGDARDKKVDKRRLTRAMRAVAFFLFALTICLYLTRLEAHTHADIFLPVDYHAVLKGKSLAGVASAPSEDDAVQAYYQGYVRQEGRPYTIRQDLLLSRLAYIKAPLGFRGETGGVTVQALCDEVARVLSDTAVDAARVFGRNRQEILTLLDDIGEHPRIGELVIREYIENNAGLAGYVLAKEEEITIALRGTDDVTDMLDNAILLPFNLSVQYPAMRALLETNGSATRIWLTGHSKGGHNAIYAASIDPRCHATGFNAPGFGIFLSDAQHDGLDRGVNFVINGDVTGFLLFHLERRAVLESAGSTPDNRHRLDNFFSVDDLTVAAQIHPLSKGSEWMTQILWLVLVFLAGYAMMRLLKRAGHVIHEKLAQASRSRFVKAR